MDVNQTEAGTHQAVGGDEIKDLAVIGPLRLRKCGQQGKNMIAFLQVSASQFADHERMADNLARFE